ncbi:Six-hairpin glycosidase-like protein [Xylaria sp. FL1042]|nr:Six-hairpin glycosidase-like protein [Xylaria sp. FL1042]
MKNTEPPRKRRRQSPSHHTKRRKLGPNNPRRQNVAQQQALHKVEFGNKSTFVLKVDTQPPQTRNSYFAPQRECQNAAILQIVKAVLKERPVPLRYEHPETQAEAIANMLAFSVPQEEAEQQQAVGSPCAVLSYSPPIRRCYSWLNFDKVLYKAKKWCCHHNTDITGDCTPYHHLTIAAPYPLGGAWLSFETIEYFLFTGDGKFARERALPILHGVMEFIYSWATERDGYWITNPSCSPENSYIIPDNMSVAGDTTGLDAGAMNDHGVEHTAQFRDKIWGPITGSYGQLPEYSQEFEENDPGHRHASPLVGVQPGSWISPLTTPEYSDAAYTLLRHRMDNGGGGNSWSVTWASLLHSRLFDAPHALKYSMQLLSRWVHNNLFSRNGGYFQIDGNSGFTASIIEMFLQSHAGVVHLGPAIPPSGIGLSSSAPHKQNKSNKALMTDFD